MVHVVAVLLRSFFAASCCSAWLLASSAPGRTCLLRCKSWVCLLLNPQPLNELTLLFHHVQPLAPMAACEFVKAAFCVTIMWPTAALSMLCLLFSVSEASAAFVKGSVQPNYKRNTNTFWIHF